MHFKLTKSLVMNNTASSGGGVTIYNSNAVLVDLLIENNNSSQKGSCAHSITVTFCNQDVDSIVFVIKGFCNQKGFISKTNCFRTRKRSMNQNVSTINSVDAQKTNSK